MELTERTAGIRIHAEGLAMLIFDCHVHLPSPGLGLAWEWQPHTPDLPAAVAYLRKCGVDLVLANSIRG